MAGQVGRSSPPRRSKSRRRCSSKNQWRLVTGSDNEMLDASQQGRTHKVKRIFLLASIALLAACATNQVDPLLTPPEAGAAPAETSAQSSSPSTGASTTSATTPAKDPALAAFFDNVDKAELALSPLSKAYRAIKDEDYGKWDEFTDAAAIEERELGRRFAAELQ